MKIDKSTIYSKFNSICDRFCIKDNHSKFNQNIEATVIKYEQYNTSNAPSKIDISYVKVIKLNIYKNITSAQLNIPKQIFINTTNHGYSSSAAQDNSTTHTKDISRAINPNLSSEHRKQDYVEKRKINTVISQSRFVKYNTNNTDSAKSVAIPKICNNYSSIQKT